MKIRNPTLAMAKVVAAGMLVAALGRFPYGYYTLLRWVVCGVAAFSACKASEKERDGWVWIFSAAALVFNPIIPIHLGRDFWTILDIGMAALLLTSIAAVDQHAPTR